jgi:group I intron endonuclease
MEVQILDKKEDVKGEIYQIRNTIDGKLYVGQTVTHRKNKGRYRPFGTMGRFKDHVSEAICNTKTKQCWYLNAAIRKYGADKFEVERLEVCDRDVLDQREMFHIHHKDSMYPNGYNLTKGGKTLTSTHVPRDAEPTAPRKRGGCVERSQETRQRIASRLKQYTSEPNIQQTRASHARQQHVRSKLERFADVKIDVDNLDSYIHPQKSRVVVRIGDKRMDFAGKHTTSEERYTLARNFLLELTTSATLPN